MRNRHERERLLAAVEDATRAASLHNSQPWRFVVSPDRVQVWLDLGHRPTIVDPQGRWALLSVGAAVANLELGLRCRLSRGVRMDLLPDVSTATGPRPADAPPELARLATAPIAVAVLGAEQQEPGDADVRLHDAIPNRRTSRWPSSGRVDDDTLLAVAAAASQAGPAGTVEAFVADEAQTTALLELTAQVDRDWRNDVAYLAEVERWAQRGGGLGIPPEALGPRDSGGHVPGRDFAVGVSGSRPAPPAEPFEELPQLVVIETAGDEHVDWLRAGIALERAMLAATAAGASVGVLGQLVENAATREQAASLLGVRRPGTLQQVLRLGRTDPRLPEAPTPRRPLDEVVTWRDG
jgi:nitroreductase